MVLVFVPRLIMFSLNDLFFFFFFWPHAQNLGFGHIPEKTRVRGVRLCSNVYVYFMQLSGEKYSSGSHLVTGINKAPSSWSVIEDVAVYDAFINNQGTVCLSFGRTECTETGLSHSGGSDRDLRVGFGTWCQCILKYLVNPDFSS